MSTKRIEKRLRLRCRADVERGTAKMNPQTMRYLGIATEVEIVVAGKKRLRFSVLPFDQVPLTEVWLNEQEMRENGIADRTIATVRRPLRES